MIDFKGKVIVIAGPTASGKSTIAISLAKEIGGYIINADSRQVYKDLNIGTAKPKFDKKISEKERLLNNVRHYLYDFVNPKEEFNLFRYQNLVKKTLENEKGIPILVGGTGLYIDSIVYNYELTESENNNSNLDNKDVRELQSIAKEHLPMMNESDRKNRHRLIRVIQKGSVEKKKGKELDNIYFVIDIDKEILRERVRMRIEEMFKKGLLEENVSLLKNGYSYQDKGMNSIGYIEFKRYFEGSISLDEVKEEIFKNTMSYIKRQRTWFKRNKKSIWVENYDEVLSKASNFILNV